MLFGNVAVKKVGGILLTLAVMFPVLAQEQNEYVKLNQLGFYPNSHKLAITPTASATEFYIKEVETGNIVYTGSLSEAQTYSLSGETVKVADFSDFTTQGTFILGVIGGKESFPFDIKNKVYDELQDGLIKALYFNRASVPLLEEHAGPWARSAGHPDTEVIIHPSAASENRPAGSTISSPGGWYDAGDFNKYVVPISSSISHMLTAYEHFPDYFNTRDLNIPESGDAVPDILDEARFALNWLLSMQDPGDGGVYHKLTHANFQGVIMPSETSAKRYVVQKGTAATLDFAAVMAQAARVYQPFDPDFADSALAAAQAAYQWAEENPNVAYDQNAINTNFEPDITTGAYGDNNFSDEFFWAKAELYITTKNDDYYPDNGWVNTGNSGWGNVQALGLFSLVTHRKQLTSIGLADTTAMKNQLINSFEWYVDDGQTAPYRSPFGVHSWQFGWGSNGGAGNLGMGIIMAYQLTGDEKYYRGAIDIMDYLMGRNAVNYSFVTGFGDQPPMHIHHRQSEADGVVEPVPGWVAGGANAGNQNDDCGAAAYHSTLPALSYLDAFCSYSTNEITTYWNSPFIYLTAALEVLTEDVTASAPNPIRFNMPNLDGSLFTPGDTLYLTWQTEGIASADLYYKTSTDEDFILLASGFGPKDTTYAEFVIPDLPGASVLFKLQDASNPQVFGYSPLFNISPTRSITMLTVEPRYGGAFTPGSILTITWESEFIDAIDLSYRLSSQTEYTSIFTGLNPSGTYIQFKVPEATGDSLIIRASASDDASVFMETDPIAIVNAVAIDSDGEAITAFRLLQNYPNPFNPSTNISFELPTATPNLQLNVFDATGRHIATLAQGSFPAGHHSVSFDAGQLSSGVYIYKLAAPSFSFSRKMMLIK